MTEAEKRASAKYQKSKCKGIYLKLNTKTDADVIAYLASVDNKQGFIKKLIRERAKFLETVSEESETILDGLEEIKEKEEG